MQPNSSFLATLFRTSTLRCVLLLVQLAIREAVLKETPTLLQVLVGGDNFPKKDDLVDMLKFEMAPMSVWRDFALAFRKAGRMDEFIYILETASDKEADQAYRENDKINKEEVNLIFSPRTHTPLIIRLKFGFQP